MRVCGRFFGQNENNQNRVLTKHRLCGRIIRVPKRKPVEAGLAGMAELADARDLKSRVTRVTYRFKPGFRHSPLLHNTAG